MELHYPDYYPEFQCTASACSDNCCIGWEIDIDRDTHGRYMAQPGPFGDRLRQNISADEPPHFLLGERERCPFLNDRNLCDIILTLGEGAICEICTQHPRFHEWFGDVKESGVGLCCEAAARLMLEREAPVTFLTAEIDEDPVPGFEEEPLFLALVPARELLVALLQDRSHPIGERLGAALVFAGGLQDCLDGDDPAREISRFTAGYQADAAPLFQAVRAYAGQGDEGDLFAQMMEFFLDLEPIDEHWPEGLRAVQGELPEILAARPDFFRDYGSRMYEYEHLAVYFIYRYLLKAVFDGDALAKVKLAAASVLFLSVLDASCWRKTGAFSLEDRVRIAKDYSKEMEYCEENLDRFWEESWQSPCFSTEELLALLRTIG